MPVYPLRPQPLVKDGSYPHMQSRDVEIWERWIDVYGSAFDTAAYDVALGGQLVDDDTIDAPTRAGWRYATAIKVDVVAIASTQALAIEVKPRASLGAVGQALGAALLLEADGALAVDIFAAVVTDTMSADVKFVADETGVLVFEVGESPLPAPGLDAGRFPQARLGRAGFLQPEAPIEEARGE